jgi:hypothetical protein
MDVTEKYVVYKLKNVMGSEEHKALSIVEFDGWRANVFDTEAKAIQALIDDDMTYEHFVILKQVYIQ